MPGLLRFDRFQLLPTRRQLLVDDGAPIELGARAFDLLCVLAERAGQLVTKNELLDQVWPDVFVEEANLHVQVSTLRKVLGRDAIATVPGRGYQFARPVQAEEQSGAQAPPARQHALPPMGLPPLLGRDAELQRLRALVEQEPLVTITGAGGTGKTLLARHVMQLLHDRWPHGADWVDLLDASGPATVPAVVAAALGFASSGRSASALARALRGFERLLVLDNAEHVLPAVRELVQAIREQAPGVRLLVTSQAPLKLADEQRLPLGGLAVPALTSTVEQACRSPAVALFVARAREADRRFRLDESTVGDVVAICIALEGSALGVQLAAALLGMQPLPEVRRRLVRERSATAPDLPRETVLHATLAWSHGLLGEAQRRVFRRLAVALGSLPLPLIAAVAGDDELDATAVADALADLVDRSLVELEAGSTEATPRYRLLDAPRAVALEELLASGEAHEVRTRLARAVAALARGVEELRMHSLNYADAAFAASRWPATADVQAVLYWALEHDPSSAAALARSSPILLLPKPEQRDCAQRLCKWAEQPHVPPAAAGEALFATAILSRRQVHPFQRADLYMAAAERYAAAGRTVDRCHALLFAVYDGGLEDAAAVLEQVRSLEDPSWPARMQSLRAIAEAATLGRADQVDAELNAWRKALELERTGMGGASLTTLGSLAVAELKVGLAQDASEHLREAAEAAQRIGHLVTRWGLSLPLLTAARLMLGDQTGAREAAEEAWPHAHHLDVVPYVATYLSLLAAREGRPRMAALLLGLADAGYARVNGQRLPFEEAQANEVAGMARSVLGDAAFEALRRAGGSAELEERISRDALARHDVTWA